MIETIANKVFINNYISSQTLQILESSAMELGGTVESPGDLAVKFGAHELTDSSPINGKLALQIASPNKQNPNLVHSTYVIEVITLTELDHLSLVVHKTLR